MADKFTLRIVTPDREFFDDEVSMVEFNTTEGEIGVLGGHVPMTVIVKPGILHVTMDGGDKYAALHSGFVEILQDRVTILAEVIEWPEEIDEDRAEEARKRAEERLHERKPDTDVVRAETALLRAVARINVINR